MHRGVLALAERDRLLSLRSSVSPPQRALVDLESLVYFMMSVDRRRAVVFAGAFALRILLILLFPSLPDLLTGRVEVSTPVNSFKRRELNCECTAMEDQMSETDIGASAGRSFSIYS